MSGVIRFKVKDNDNVYKVSLLFDTVNSIIRD